MPGMIVLRDGHLSDVCTGPQVLLVAFCSPQDLCGTVRLVERYYCSSAFVFHEKWRTERFWMIFECASQIVYASYSEFTNFDFYLAHCLMPIPFMLNSFWCAVFGEWRAGAVAVRFWRGGSSAFLARWQRCVPGEVAAVRSWR
eukprot:2831002-Pleurochrysis_carterae.AAC.1